MPEVKPAQFDFEFVLPLLESFFERPELVSLAIETFYAQAANLGCVSTFWTAVCTA